jgi:hypothetical protein
MIPKPKAMASVSTMAMALYSTYAADGAGAGCRALVGWVVLAAGSDIGAIGWRGRS